MTSIQSTDIWLIGQTINELPPATVISKQQVLLLFFDDYKNHQRQNRSKYCSAKNVSEKVITRARENNIEVIHVETCVQKVISLHDKWYKLFKRKNSKSHVDIQRREEFLRILSEKFDVQLKKKKHKQKRRKIASLEAGCHNDDLKERVSNFYIFIANRFCLQRIIFFFKI